MQTEQMRTENYLLLCANQFAFSWVIKNTHTYCTVNTQVNGREHICQASVNVDL